MNTLQQIDDLQIYAHTSLKRYLSNQNWQFKINSNKRRLGVCKYGPRTIEISHYHLIHSPIHLVRDTILHEIAHALTPHSGHNRIWKEQAILIGALPTACKAINLQQFIPAKWHANCPSCNRLYKKHRYRYQSNHYSFCIDCSSKNGKLTWKQQY
jgi:hypothetical protein